MEVFKDGCNRVREMTTGCEEMKRKVSVAEKKLSGRQYWHNRVDKLIEDVKQLRDLIEKLVWTKDQLRRYADEFSMSLRYDNHQDDNPYDHAKDPKFRGKRESLKRKTTT